MRLKSAAWICCRRSGSSSTASPPRIPASPRRAARINSTISQSPVHHYNGLFMSDYELVLLKNIHDDRTREIHRYVELGGYAAARKAVKDMTPSEVIDL